MAKLIAQLAGTDFKHLDPLVLKPPRLKAVPFTSKMTNVPTGNPTFTPANMEQIVALAIQIALVKAQRSQATPGPHRAPPVDDCPIVNLISATTFGAQNVNYFNPNPGKEAVEIKDNHSVYHNVLSFTN